MPLSLPPNLRQCDEAVATTEPTAFATVGDLLVGYGVERTGRLEVSACHRETIRLIDLRHKQMSTGQLGGN